MKKCFSFKNHGRTIKGSFRHKKIGFNFCFTDLQAAIGLAQLKKLNKIIKFKKDIYERYRRLLSPVKEIVFPYQDPRSKPVFWFTNILVKQPERLARYLGKHGVQTRRFFYPIHRQPCLKNRYAGGFKNSLSVYNLGLSLPSSSRLTRGEQEYICDKIIRFYKEY
jgi:perosamine synthetase